MDNGTTRRRRPGLLTDLPDDLPPELAAFAAELRRGRANVDMNLAEFAKLTFSSRASVSRWLNGQALPTEKQAIDWARACGTDESTMVRLLAAAATAPSATDSPGGMDDGSAVAEEEPAIGAVPSAARYRFLRLSAVLVLVAGLLATALIIAFQTRQHGHSGAASTSTPSRAGDVTVTAGPKSSVGNCEIFAGTSNLPPGRTIVLGQRNHSDATKTIYLQPVNNWQKPNALPRWTGSQYFGTGDTSVGQIFEIYVISMNVNIVRAAMQDRVNDIWHVRRLPPTSQVKQTVTVTRAARPGACGN